MTRLAFVDTETTGLNRYHQIWEIGLIVRTEGGVDSEYEWQMPVRLGSADPKALELNHYFQRANEAKQYPESVVAAKFADLTRGAVLIVNNPVFDVPRLENLLRKNGQCPMWHYHPVDVRDLAVGYILGKGLWVRDDIGPVGKWSGSKVGEALGCPIKDSDLHTALGDARQVRDMWDAVTGAR